MIAVDTNLFIYVLAEHPDYGLAAEALLNRGEQEPLIASVLVIGELLGVSDPSKATQLSYARLMLSSLHGLQLMPADETIVYAATALMQQQGLRLQDAIHLATAHQAGATEFWTNDKKLAKVTLPGLRVRLLSER